MRRVRSTVQSIAEGEDWLAAGMLVTERADSKTASKIRCFRPRLKEACRPSARESFPSEETSRRNQSFFVTLLLLSGLLPYAVLIGDAHPLVT